MSDNKGPILAVACAAAALRQRRELDVDLVMLIEGEEEAGSKGFAAAVRRHKVSYFVLLMRFELMGRILSVTSMLFSYRIRLG